MPVPVAMTRKSAATSIDRIARFDQMTLVSSPSLRRCRVGRPGRLFVSTVIVVAIVACGGDDDVEQPPDGSEPTGEPADASAGGDDLPDDFPLSTPDGGTVLSALFDEASGGSNIVITYPSGTLDGLAQEYDTFFDTVDGETVRVPPTDGLAGWQNHDAGYSVVVNGQNADVQVGLQTGIRLPRVLRSERC